MKTSVFACVVCTTFSAVLASRMLNSLSPGNLTLDAAIRSKLRNVLISSKSGNSVKLKLNESRLPSPRAKRDTTNCTVSVNWPTAIQDLNLFLSANQTMGLYPQKLNLPALPANQPTGCPAAEGSWWPRNEDNLRSTCPWVYNDVDLGDSFYPRYLRQATCLCSSCINANVMGCKTLRQEVTVFQRGPCKDGLAVMTTVKKVIAVGCFCSTSAVQSTDVSGPLPTD